MLVGEDVYRPSEKRVNAQRAKTATNVKLNGELIHYEANPKAQLVKQSNQGKTRVATASCAFDFMLVQSDHLNDGVRPKLERRAFLGRIVIPVVDLRYG